MTILTILEDVLGSSKKFPNGEHYFNCPFCYHPKKKFCVNEHSLKFHCWVCGVKGNHIVWLLRRLNTPKETIRKVQDLIGETPHKRSWDGPAPTQIELPAEYKPLWKPQKTHSYYHAIRYLKNRGISALDILRYRMGYCDNGSYANRIIIPSYDEKDELNYFIARSYYESPLPYKNPPISKNTVIFENMIDWSEPLVLCEGAFDAIAIKRNAVPILGKFIPDELWKKIALSDVPEVIVYLDEDAQRRALEIEKTLQEIGIPSRLVVSTEKDAGEIGFIKAWNLINQATTTQFQDYVKMRISMI